MILGKLNKNKSDAEKDEYMFRLLITCDTNQETGIRDAILSLTANNFYNFIEEVNYGNTLQHLAIFFMCLDPKIQFKPRIRFTRMDQTLCLDIILDYYQFVMMTHEQRVSELCKKLILEMPVIIQKYEIIDFDLDKLVRKFSQWFNEYNFIIDISDDHKNELELDYKKMKMKNLYKKEKILQRFLFWK